MVQAFQLLIKLTHMEVHSNNNNNNINFLLTGSSSGDDVSLDAATAAASQADCVSVGARAAPAHPVAEASSQPASCELTLASNIVKHIPRAAREHCANKLTAAINSILSGDFGYITEFPGCNVNCSPRGGCKHNLTTLLWKRCMKDLTKAPSDGVFRKKTDTDSALRVEIISKLEDGNIKAAIRMIA